MAVFDERRNGNERMPQEKLPEGVFSEAQNFFRLEMEALDHVGYGEYRAKKAIVVAKVAQTAVALSGGPGGFKSGLARYAMATSWDANPEDTVKVPVDSQLQPVQVVGGRMESSRVIDNHDANGKVVSNRQERWIDDVTGLVLPTTKNIWADEGPRISPWVLNALLGAPEEHELTTTAGVVPLPFLRLYITTNNAAETRQASHKVSVAYATRHMLGAIMGGNVSFEDKVKLAQGIKPDPSQIKQHTDNEQLERLQLAAEITRLPDDVAERAVRIVDAAKGFLIKNYNIREENRMYEQIGKVARINGMFKGQTGANADVDEALGYVLGSRFGLLIPDTTNSVNPNALLDSAVADILEQAG
jgi:MoxR-like ATPase